jgi:hypothetical protein
MPIPVPGHWFRRLAAASQVYDALIALAALGAGAAGVFRLVADGYVGLAWLVGGCALAVCALSVVRAILSYRTQAARESLHELQGCLMTLHSLLVDTEQPDEVSRHGLRLTVHVLQSDGSHLQQVLDYVGDPRGGRTAGRRFSVHCGIAGHVYRTREPHQAQRQNVDHEAYVRELVELWAYDEAEARRIDPSAMSWMAAPITVRGRLEGVLFLDSLDPDFFDEVRQDLILRAVTGVAKFVAERYAER